MYTINEHKKITLIRRVSFCLYMCLWNRVYRTRRAHSTPDRYPLEKLGYHTFINEFVAVPKFWELQISGFKLQFVHTGYVHQ